MPNSTNLEDTCLLGPDDPVERLEEYRCLTKSGNEKGTINRTQEKAETSWSYLKTQFKATGFTARHTSLQALSDTRPSTCEDDLEKFIAAIRQNARDLTAAISNGKETTTRLGHSVLTSSAMQILHG